MPAYRASRWDLKTCTRLRPMIARRTRLINSSLLPLNITPAMTSTHPPVWWKAPLGPLTSGRDLCEDLHEVICQEVHCGAGRRAGREAYRLCLRAQRGRRDHLLV